MALRVYDVVVVGAGNAALCAALAAREGGASVLILERAPEQKRGGNSFFTGGLVRVPYRGIEDIRQLVPDMTDREAASVEVGAYTEDDFYDDMLRVTDNLCDPDLTNTLVEEAFPTLKWLTGKGVRFILAMGRQAFKAGEKMRFWCGAVLEYVGGGAGLVQGEVEAALREGAEIWYESRAYQLITDDGGRVTGVRVRRGGRIVDVPARTVVLACGGFEANPEMRARYLGPGWDLARVRGTEYNTGDGISMALAVGAQPYGHFSGCHAVAWDVAAPPGGGDRKVGEMYQKHSYPLGIVVNRDGRRFVDEGADFRNYTYARYGREILQQPGMVAFQIFDQKVVHLLRDEYRIRQVTKATAESIEALAQGLGISPAGLAETVRAFNAAVQPGPWDPTVKDGKRTLGIDPPKSNWALPLDTPPYVGYAVTCGITFTFGGLRVDREARVLDVDGRPIPGLYAAGELVGGLFYHNYPGGTGLTSGAVFGRIAGRSAAATARQA